MCFTSADKFRVTAGEDALVEYRFHTNKIVHLFCSKCGIEAFGRGKNQGGGDTIAVNVRSIDELDLTTLKRLAVDGKSF